MVSKECPTLKAIIYTRNYTTADQPAHPPKVSGVKVLSMDEAIELGKANPTPMEAPSPDHIGLIMYTSGSTGKPKGVMLKQSNICAAVAGLLEYTIRMPGFANIMNPNSPKGQETYLAYLPAAHILEFSAECAMLCNGAALGFSDPKTISSKGAVRKMPDGSLNLEPTGFGNHPPGGIQEFAPTLMAAVPKIWDILKKGVESVIAKQSPVVKALWCAGFATRSFALKTGRSTPVIDVLFKKTYVMLGGRLKLCITGGGPISPDVQNFIRVVFKTNLVQGYALTETCSAGTIQPAWSVENGVVGPPVKSVEMRLNDCSEVKDRDEKSYLNTDKSHLGVPCLGRGEVWIRGGPVSPGYYVMEKKTREEFDEQGWFHTGDIAIWTNDGMIKIVDRLKNLIKLKGGEYIAIESMESTYANSVFVNGIAGGIMCYGSGEMDRPVALVQVNVGELVKWAKGSGVGFSSVQELCDNEAAVAAVTKDLNGIGKGKLGANELLASVVLLSGEGNPEAQDLDSPWTPENQFLTASNKLNRKPIEKGFEKLLKPLIQKGIR
jgi:long-chain acyl-CoA synthetase